MHTSAKFKGRAQKNFAIILASLHCITASEMKLDIGDPVGTPMFCLLYSSFEFAMMLSDGISTAFSNSKCATTSFVKSTGMEGKRDMTSNDIIHSSGFTVNPWIR